MKTAILMGIIFSTMGGADIMMNSIVHIFSMSFILIALGLAYSDIITFSFLWNRRRHIIQLWQYRQGRRKMKRERI